MLPTLRQAASATDYSVRRPRWKLSHLGLVVASMAQARGFTGQRMLSVLVLMGVVTMLMEHDFNAAVDRNMRKRYREIGHLQRVIGCSNRQPGRHGAGPGLGSGSQPSLESA